jgi:hypothetical protein
LYVRGYVFAQVRDQFEKLHDIALPNASVFLIDARAAPDTSNPVASNISDLSGHFTLKAAQPGAFQPGPPAYVICVKAEGFDDICGGRVFASEDVGHILVRPKTGDTAAVFGSLTFHDGNIARGFEPLFGVNAYPAFEVKGSSGIIYKGFVNNNGSYIVPRVPINEDFVLHASIEKESLERTITKEAHLTPNVGYEFTFQFANSAPKVRLVSASSNGKLLQIASPGSTVKLRAVAEDAELDSLDYRWLPPDTGIMVGPNNNPEFDWKIPSQDGIYTVRVLVGDGRGGYASSFINLLATSKGVTFSGTVIDVNGNPVPGALVDVNGRLTNADARGQAELTVPVQDKYVVTVRQAGPSAPGRPVYGTTSFIYTSGIRGQLWRLRPAQVATFDPTLPIVSQHDRTNRDCDASRPRLSKIDWSPYLKPGLFDWQYYGSSLSLAEKAINDPGAVRQVTRLLARTSPQLAKFFFDTADLNRIPGNTGKSGHGRGSFRYDDRDEAHRFIFDFNILGDGDEEPPPYVDGPLPCLNGIRVEIPANALENSTTKKPPAGPVQVTVSMVDLNGPDQMPGDFTAIDSTGQRTAMESYGAGSIEITSGTERFNLKPGATATVTIPVDATQLAGKPVLPASIPFLFYDESAGVWEQDGTAHLTGSGATAAYVATTKHFSTLNGDILKSGESCVAVEVDPAAGFTFPLNVEVSLQPSKPNPAAVQVRTLTINSSGEHSVIYNLPNNQDIALTPIVSGKLPSGDSGDVPAGVFVVNTGGAQNSTTAPPTPNADGTYYNGASGPCASRVTLKKLNASTQPGAPLEFLQGLYFEASNINELAATSPATANAIVQGAKDYYIQADPRTKRPTLDAFKQVNRFGQPQNLPDEVEYSAVYANGGDLGFGREMHCRRNLAADSIPAGKKFDYACYVSNCHQPPNLHSDQVDADDAAANACDATDATVTMEYSRVENPSGDPQEFPNNDRAVKFYAYVTKTGTQVFQADLDGHGARPLPNLCVICHGGKSADAAADPGNPLGPKKPAYAARSDVISEGSKFLPFDLHFYKFPAVNPRPAQEDTFRNMNINIVEQVATQINPADPIAELINAWYPGAAGPEKDDAVIAGWDTGNPNNTENRMYRDVFARACRTCHVAQPYTAPTFTSVAVFKGAIQTVQQRVCINKVMPHAQRTSDIFWTSLNPNMAGFLEIFGQSAPSWLTDINSQCGLFNQDSNALKSVFEANVYPILTGNCASSSCHGNLVNANWHVGSVADTYNELLTTLTKRPITGNHYIKPNDLPDSLVYQKIEGTPQFGSRMPLGGANLTTTDTDGNGVIDAVDFQNWITLFNAAGP